MYYGLKPSSFLHYFSNLSDKYSLKLNDPNPIREYIDFIIYSNVLEENGIDIRGLVKQIKPCKDILGIRHASSMAKLTYIYLKNGHSIKFLQKGADFLIDGIRTDLKVIHPETSSSVRQPKTTKSGMLDIKNELILKISKSISSRFLEGSNQAESLYFDLSYYILFGMIDLFVNDLEKIVQPKEYRLVFYNYKFFYHNVDISKGDRSLGKRMFPDLYAFAGYHLDFEPFLWKFFSHKLLIKPLGSEEVLEF